jgi:membrane associated rhomboid family serine protease
MFNQLPKATKILLWVNAGMFLLQLLVGQRGGLEPLLLWPIGGADTLGNPIASALGNFMPWQLVTYAFLHDPRNFGHIFFNMLALVMFGAPLEYTWGTKRFVTFYFVCVVGAGLTFLAWSTLMGLAVPVLGASGGVFGLLLAYGMLFPKQRVMLLLPPVPMNARTLVIVYGVIELLFGLTGAGGNVAHFAHLGGMLFGWLTIRYWRGQLPFKRRKRRPPPPPPPPKFKIVR